MSYIHFIFDSSTKNANKSKTNPIANKESFQ